MSKIRVLIVDDAVVVRRIVTDVLSGDAGIEVAGAAANGKIALARIPQLKPDILTLDMEMPDMDGIQTLRAVRKEYPKLPVIMFSTLTERGAAATIEAIEAGANDYVTKPANVGSVGTAKTRIREELIPKIYALCSRHPAAMLRPASTTIVPPKPILRPRQAHGQLGVVVIGVSTGGPNALAEVIPQLPADLPVAVLIVQHMPPLFTKALADRLNQASKIRVREAQNGDVAVAGNAYIAPGNFHLMVERSGGEYALKLNQDPPENSCRPAVDVLFRSAATAFGAGTLGVVLTGMGQDGLHGCQIIHDAGGRIIVQDEATSVVWGMPGFVARAGLAEQQIPLKEIASNIARRIFDSRPPTRMSA